MPDVLGSTHRPLAVWLLMLALLASGILFTVGSARFFWFAAPYLIETRSFIALAVAAVGRLSLIAAFVVALHASFGRRAAGRWLGLLFIAAFAMLGVAMPDTTGYASEAESAGGHLARTILLPLLCVWWAYAFGFSRKARRYFSC